MFSNFRLKVIGGAMCIRTLGLVTQESVYKWIPLGFLIYLGGMYFLDGRQHKTIFYFLVGLPALFLVVRSVRLFRAGPWPMISLITCLSYFTFSTLWSGESDIFWRAAKHSFYIFCLLLAAEAVVNRFNQEFVARFIVVVGGVAICGYMLSVVVGGISLSSLISNRYSLQDMAGWGESSPITSAVLLGVLVLASWWLFPTQKRLVQLILVAIIALAVGMMFFTKSRGPLLALGLVSLILTLIRRAPTDWLLLLLGCFSVGVLAAFSSVGDAAAARATAPNYRVEIWLHALGQLQSSWIYGQGLGHDAAIPLSTNGRLVTHSHSSVLEMFRIGGLLGGTLFLGTLFLLVRRALINPRNCFFLFWLAFGLLCLSTDGRSLLVGPASEWFEFWIPLFLLYSHTCCAGLDKGALGQEGKHAAP